MENEDFSKEEFVSYQNSKFRVRRRIAVGTTIAYFVIIFYILVKFTAIEIERVEGLVTQVSLFSAGVLGFYFGGSSYEETRVDRKALLDEFKTLQSKRNTSVKKEPNESNENEVG